MDIDGQRELMLEENSENINWFPPHVKHGRFEKNIQQAPDWNLSRDRFWASPMPIWEAKQGSKTLRKVIGSFDELEKLSGKRLDDYHRPWIDDVTFELDGLTYRRIDKVMDSWFEAGSMPFAQFHYPFENVEKFEASFPGDFIVEYIGQVRAWFYYVHAVSVGLFGTNAFKNVIVTGNVAGNDGRKMSKSYGNYTDPNELMNEYSADSLRFLLLSSPLLNGEDFALQDKEVGDVARKLSMVGNMYDFFTMYAEVDGWEWDGQLSDPSETLSNPLDQWIVSRLHQLVGEVEHHMDGYDIPSAVKPILSFIDDASNWYVRRSRRRFWKSGDDQDKAMAYRTLHYVLVRLMYAMAPFTPFLAEEYYRKLTGRESVHLEDWLPAGHVNELVIKDMETVREYVTQGLALRAEAGIKVRQPIASIIVPVLGQFADFTEILQDELNVKQVKSGDVLALDTKLTPELRREGMMREIVRHVQAARKAAGLNVDDRIVLSLTSSDKHIKQAIDEHEATVAAETLASQVKHTPLNDSSYQTEVMLDGQSLAISLKRAA
jgi:isoleucyl-tRNA synthetase